MATLTAYASAQDGTTPAGFSGQLTSPANAVGSSEATNSSTGNSTQNADFGTNFSFDFSSIPAGSTINSVLLEAREWINTANRGLAGWRLDSTAGTQIANENTVTLTATSATAGTAPAESTWSTWTTLPTLAQLQGSTFRARCRWRRTASQSTTFVLDWVRITVDYTPPGVALSKSATDTLNFADSATAAQVKPRSTTDTLAFADTSAGAQAKARSSSDTLALADTSSTEVVSQGLSKSVADTLAVADANARSLTLPRTATDTLSLADSRTSAQAKVRALVDTLAVTDANSRSRSLGRSSADSLALVDVLAIARQIARALTETLSASDSVEAVGAGQLNKSVQDTLSIAASASPARDLVHSGSDSLVLADSATFSKELVRIVSDALVSSDEVARALIIYVSAPTDALSFVEQVEYEGPPAKLATEFAVAAKRLLVTHKHATFTFEVNAKGRILPSRRR